MTISSHADVTQEKGVARPTVGNRQKHTILPSWWCCAGLPKPLIPRPISGPSSRGEEHRPPLAHPLSISTRDAAGPFPTTLEEFFLARASERLSGERHKQARQTSVRKRTLLKDERNQVGKGCGCHNSGAQHSPATSQSLDM